MQETVEDTHPLADLLRELREEAAIFCREEIALAKSELSEKANRLTRNAIFCGIGAGFAFAGLIVLLMGLSYLLTYLYVEWGMEVAVAGWLGPTSLGFIVALIGWALINKARHAIAREQIAPKQTIQSLRETKDWAQNKLHRTHTHETPAI